MSIPVDKTILTQLNEMVFYQAQEEFLTREVQVLESRCDQLFSKLFSTELKEFSTSLFTEGEYKRMDRFSESITNPEKLTTTLLKDILSLKVTKRRFNRIVF